MPLFVFDLDGTLINSGQSILESFRFGLQHIGYGDLVIDEVKALRQDLRVTLLNAGEKIGQEFTDFEIEDFVRSYRVHHSLFPDGLIQPYEGVVEVLEFLKSRDNQIAIATTKHSEQASHMLGRLKMEHYFDHIQGTDVGMRYKPEPDILHAVLNRLERDPAESFYMGDSEHDLAAAATAGMWKIAANYGYSTAEELNNQAPHFCIDQMKDFLTHYDDMLEMTSSKPTSKRAPWHENCFIDQAAS